VIPPFLRIAGRDLIFSPCVDAQGGRLGKWVQIFCGGHVEVLDT